MTEQEENWRAQCITGGFDAAMAGRGIMTNPHPQDTPAFRWFVDGWCAFHSKPQPPTPSENQK